MKIEKDEVRKFFILFLINANCYTEFVSAISTCGRHGITTIKEAFDYLEDKNLKYGGIINTTLIWHNTIEGNKFWHKQHNEFYNKYTESRFIENHNIRNEKVIKYKSIW